MKLDFGCAVQEIVNLTPHPVVICLMENNPVTIPSEGSARVGEDNPCVHYLPDGLVVRQLAYTSIEGLPPPAPKTLFLVSRIVLQAALIAFPERRDLVAPGDLIRDANGAITGMQNLVTLTGRLKTGPGYEEVS
jgi:hypothetical protein